MKKDRVTTYTYNAANQRTSMTEGQGGTCAAPTATAATRTSTYQYVSTTLDAPTVIESPSVASGQVRRTTLTYGDTRFPTLPTAITQSGFTPSGSAVSRAVGLTYNASGQVVSLDGPRTDVNDTTTFTYYECTTGGACGQLKTITNALNQTTTYNTYDAHGRVTEMTDPNGLKTAYAYDLRGRWSLGHPNPSGGTARTTQYAYDDNGNVTEVTDPTGRKLTYTYDNAQYLRTVTDNLGNKVSYSYDLRGNRTKEEVTDSSNTLVRTIETAYDLRNRVSQINTGGSLTTLVHDAIGNLTKTTPPEPAGPGHAQVHHPHLRCPQPPHPDPRHPGRHHHARPHADRRAPIRHRPERGQYHLHARRSRPAPLRNLPRPRHHRLHPRPGRQCPDPHRRPQRHRHLRLRRRQPHDERVVLNRPEPQRHLYLRLGNNLHERHRAPVPGHRPQRHHELCLRRLRQRHPAPEGRTQCGLRAPATPTTMPIRVLTITYPDNRVVTYTRDILGRITHISHTHNGTTTVLTQNRTYRADGLLTAQTFGSGLTESRGYDTQGRMTTWTLGGETRTYTYDANSNVATRTTPTESRTYVHDTEDRLTEDRLTAGSGSTNTMGYDLNGNRTSLNGTTYGYTPNTNRLTQVGTSSLTLDPAGNTTQDADGQTYTHDAAGRLAEVKRHGRTLARYTYNHRHQRTRRDLKGPRRDVIYHYGLNGEPPGRDHQHRHPDPRLRPRRHRPHRPGHENHHRHPGLPAPRRPGHPTPGHQHRKVHRLALRRQRLR